MLRPFLDIIKFPDLDPTVRELTVRCVSQLSSSRGENLRRGWQTVLRVMCHACTRGSVFWSELERLERLGAYHGTSDVRPTW